MVVANLCLAFLIWVYIDPPGHTAFVQLAPTMALALARMPGVRPTSLFRPFAVGCAFAGVLYIFVMPQLTGYWELGIMIFGATFLIYYLFWEPHQGLAKFRGIIPVIVLLSVQNEQSYSFASYANSVAMILLGIGLLVVTSYIPHSPRPEKTFLRLLGRFFRRSRFLMSQLGAEWGRKKNGLLARWRTDYYRSDLLALSQKLSTWAKSIDGRAFPENTPEQVQALAMSLQGLALRIRILVDARDYPQAELLVQHLSDDIRAWRVLIQDLFLRWVTDPKARPSGELQEKLATRITGIETHIQNTLSLIEQGELSDED